MKRLLFLFFTVSMLLSVSAIAQDGTATNISVSGTVVSADTNALKHKKIVDAIDTSVVFLTSDGYKYYLIADKNKLEVFQKLVQHHKSPMKISGFDEEVDRNEYIIVESFFFL